MLKTVGNKIQKIHFFQHFAKRGQTRTIKFSKEKGIGGFTASYAMPNTSVLQLVNPKFDKLLISVIASMTVKCHNDTKCLFHISIWNNIHIYKEVC